MSIAAKVLLSASERRTKKIGERKIGIFLFQSRIETVASVPENEDIYCPFAIRCVQFATAEFAATFIVQKMIFAAHSQSNVCRGPPYG